MLLSTPQKGSVLLEYTVFPSSNLSQSPRLNLASVISQVARASGSLEIQGCIYTR